MMTMIIQIHIWIKQWTLRDCWINKQNRKMLFIRNNKQKKTNWKKSQWLSKTYTKFFLLFTSIVVARSWSVFYFSLFAAISQVLIQNKVKWIKKNLHNVFYRPTHSICLVAAFSLLFFSVSLFIYLPKMPQNSKCDRAERVHNTGLMSWAMKITYC